jgi:hypothetical protein
MKKEKVNRFIIPQWLCHKMGWHKWFWATRNKSFLAGKCKRCGMTGSRFWELQKKELAPKKKDKKSQ